MRRVRNDETEDGDGGSENGSSSSEDDSDEGSVYVGNLEDGRGADSDIGDVE